MPRLPIRDLAQQGILLDPNPYDLPANAFSGGSNVAFANGKASRAPVFKTIVQDVGMDPQFVVGYRPSTGQDVTFVCGQQGQVRKVTNGVTVDVTPEGQDPTNSAQSWTSTFLGDVLYVNRPSHPPSALLPAARKFVPVAGWDPTWRARSIRAFRDVLVAFNLQKGGQSYPTTIKWSDYALAGQMPASWDPAPENAANEVVVAQMDSPIVDAMLLRDILVVYTEGQIWALTWTGDTSDAGQNLITNRLLFTEGGMIAPNCAVEVEGKHFVFGTDDIYVHDGMTKTSIVQDKIRRWVFSNLDERFGERCFVLHMPGRKEILFAFPSKDDAAAWKNPTRCNRGAVYNYTLNVWSTIDLPNVASGTCVNADPAQLWNTQPDNTWAEEFGSWYDIGYGFDTHVVFCASTMAGGATTPRLLAYDHMNRGALSYPYDPQCNAPALLERVGIDLDDAGSDLTTFKLFKRVYPQVVSYGGVPLQIQVGSAVTPASPVVWGPWVSYNPSTQYKVDVRNGGRYLAMRFRVDAPADFDVSGFDAEVVSWGSR